MEENAKSLAAKVELTETEIAAFKEVKLQRTKADSLYLTCRTLPASREVSLATTAFQSARQFMGLCLGEMGAEYPYSKSMDPTNPRVDPQQDAGEILRFGDPAVLMSLESKFVHVREYAGKCIAEWDHFIRFYHPTSPKMHVALHQSLAHLMSGRMWLGEALVIKKQEAPQVSQKATQ